MIRALRNFKKLCAFYGRVLPSAGHTGNRYVNIPLALTGLNCSDYDF